MKKKRSGYSFGTFQGVFTPSILTIIGVVMYLRFGWMLGNVGIAQSLAIVTIGSAITFLTGLSISALATNMRMRGGGAYFMLSRSFGPETGVAVGVPLALAQAIGVSFYVSGFSEALVGSGLPVVSGLNPQHVALGTLTFLALVSSVSADLALKSQYFVMAAIVASLVSLFCGGAPSALAAPDAASVPPALGFWPVFAVFFPAVTGILSGVGMSGDLKDPGKSIPRGTIAAVLTGYAIYMAVPLFLDWCVKDAAVLRSDTMILAKCARWQMPILVGVWAATISSAVGSFLCAPRVVQALARDRLAPRFLGRGYGASDDPRVASFLCYAVAAAGVLLGDINAIAPVLTMFNLSTYALLNLSAALEETMDPPSWRPTFRVRSFFSYAGFAGCVGAMLMISSGWTLVALACELAIFLVARRRSRNPRWADMRDGLYLSLARFALRRLERHRRDVRNWTPNLLVLTPIPAVLPRLFSFARGVSGGSGFITVASVVQSEYCEESREAELAQSLLRQMKARGLRPIVRVASAADACEGLKGFVRMYGYGPLTPNTVVLGIPRPGANSTSGGVARETYIRRRNIVFVGAGECADPSKGG
ncbi:MAG: Na-K-Cl cotransporter, partial [Kiritimatiellae bacterium]|nr:Na-K-Cl cotransporter [Kiritimatiellia bacterium]